MSGSYLPNTDSGLLAWAQNFSTLITATPTAYGLVAADATALAALVSAYESALTAAVEPSTRTKVTVAAKNTAKATLKLQIRADVMRIQGTTTVTAAQKEALGITVADRSPSPVPPPATRPVLSVVGPQGRAVVVRIVDEATPLRRGKPDGATGAEIYSFVPATAGQTPPADLEQWRYEGLATRWQFVVDFDPTDVGKTATLVARWINGKGQAGPLSALVTAKVADEMAQAA